MTTLTPTQVAELRRKIEAKYFIEEFAYGSWCVFERPYEEVSEKSHSDPLDAEAEMEAIIQDEVKVAMEAEEDVNGSRQSA